ncbi:hypothetical protein [Sphaerospermopsis sp. FACHB-1194]|uniref:hypothetical protein n=1 Tax=Sphaerospermopsis sp. FACHB-1194 TaxID=2692862 RepID=UPI001680D8D3|nr:hypothetical protein [Sphaerospermopsis sp. FACHB-1194]MBD2146156.1 hypothetical protein [Sphaerospermopsis sp. FACHB-1194]
MLNPYKSQNIWWHQQGETLPIKKPLDAGNRQTSKLEYQATAKMVVHKQIIKLVIKLGNKLGNKHVCKSATSPQSPVTSPQSPVTSPQSPVPSHQSPVPSPQSPAIT